MTVEDVSISRKAGTHVNIARNVILS